MLLDAYRSIVALNLEIAHDGADACSGLERNTHRLDMAREKVNAQTAGAMPSSIHVMLDA